MGTSPRGFLDAYCTANSAPRPPLPTDITLLCRAVCLRLFWADAWDVWHSLRLLWLRLAR